jgi:hypothetical protein
MPDDDKVRRKAETGERVRQVAAIPYRLNSEGEPEVMVITSRTTKRFVVPKGWPMKGKSGRKTATIEARQEAGVLGKTLKKPAGSYSYWKRMSKCFVRVDVKVFLLTVSEVIPKWEEHKRRKRGWLSPAEAALLIDEPELASLVAALGNLLKSQP